MAGVVLRAQTCVVDTNGEVWPSDLGSRDAGAPSADPLAWRASPEELLVEGDPGEDKTDGRYDLPNALLRDALGAMGTEVIPG